LPADENSEVGRTASLFMTAHGNWVSQQLQFITTHLSNRSVWNSQTAELNTYFARMHNFRFYSVMQQFLAFLKFCLVFSFF